MRSHRLRELLELLEPYWKQDPELNLIQVLQKIAAEAGFEQPLAELTDEVVIYHLKMHGKDKDAPIPGIQKDYEDDFKTALLKARGILKD
ncbi:YihD family protein [Neisseria sp.]|uniref:YihD family protein n=1 Tax=Neisseria sp. TaxID=192066 RepID=UPI0035A195DF